MDVKRDRGLFRTIGEIAFLKDGSMMPPVFFEMEIEKGKYSLVAIDEIHYNIHKKESILSLTSILGERRGETSFLTCWRPKDITYIRDVYPKLFSYFDRFITLGQLTEEETKQLIAKRLKYFEKEHRKNEYWPFTPDSIGLIVKYSRGIPGTVVSLAFTSTLEAARSAAPKVSPEYVEGAAKEMGLDLINRGIDKFLKGKTPALEKVLRALLLCEPATTTKVAKIASISRSTASQYLNELHNYRLVDKQPELGKKVSYVVAPLVADHLELGIMEEFTKLLRRPFRH